MVKRVFEEGGMRVPGILKWPGVIKVTLKTT